MSRGLWAGLGSQRAFQGEVCAACGDSGPGRGRKGRPRGFWAGRGSGGESQKGLGRSGIPRPSWAGPGRGSEGRSSARARPGRGWGRGAPAPHKGPGSGGRAQSGAGGRREGWEGRDRRGPGGRAEGGREGGSRRAARATLGRRGRSSPDCPWLAPRPAPGPRVARRRRRSAPPRRPHCLSGTAAAADPGRPPASPAEPETTASPGRAPTAGPRRRLGPAAPTDSLLGQSSARTVAHGSELPTWRGSAGLWSEGRSPQPIVGPDGRGGGREGGRRDSSPAEGSARCAPHVEGGGGGTGAPCRACALRPAGGAA